MILTGLGAILFLLTAALILFPLRTINDQNKVLAEML